MQTDYIYPRYEVERRESRCSGCGLCVKECSYGVHYFSKDGRTLLSDDSKCVNCQRCVATCPTHAIKIVKSNCDFRENYNWSGDSIREIMKQAGSGGVLLSSMGNPQPFPVYWDKLLLNASQVTNPPIDPLREPMETRVFLGKKPSEIARDKHGRMICVLPPRLSLELPVLFSAMSYGSISYNAHAALAAAATALGTCYNTGEGGLHENFYRYGANTIVQVASGRFGVHKDYLEAGAAIEIKMGQGAKPGIGGHLPGSKIVGDVSRTRMIPEGSDAISPAPHHDIYSIEDLRQLVFSLKEATEYKKPVIVKIAAVHNIAAIASGIARSGADARRTRARRRGYETARRRDQKRRVSRRRRQHTQLYRRSQGDRARRGRVLYRYSRTDCDGLSYVPQLSERQMQLGHRDAKPRPRQTTRPRRRRAPPRQSADRLETRDNGDHGRHGYQFDRGA